ncbi:MazG family protein [Curtobacterium aurantiacum]|uniref:MazG family protein n=1 Tax=Curtobacterium aurantiacum TaxID=3236919 RepID=A0ABS5VIL8_9MICO|nr:MazG family protein [Curtobacterium flaccumfaciens]MBT1546131.1 MazG family protein [Curtobacterium flaccumfaciens pv. flaccumfaciens]MBT1589308.1 MazG family protein [Curtobacterium flaccumfaciens pv. flaccumfaciens]
MTAVPDLVTVVDRLLAEDGGCVWNRAQTHASLARYAVEESYELVDAIDDGDPDDLREELGDLLYQVVLHAGIAARAGDFTLEDVAAGVRDKMTRRHPHVFGDEAADTVEDVVRVWRAAKAAEKASRRSAFDGVPRAMPPLERAVKLLERLEERGDADVVVASVVGAGSGGGGREARGASSAPAADDGVGAVDPVWGRAVLGEVAAAARRGVDPVASLRAAVSALEEAGRAAE